MKKILAFNLAILALGLVLLELLFGSWFTEASTLYRFIKPRNVSKTYEHTFPGQPSPSSYTIDSHGFRGLDKGLENIFILTVGGSTTDQKYIDDDFTFEELLQKRFEEDGRDVDVVSAGIDGQSTYGHLKNFPYWFSKLPGFKPRYILYYAGVNDFYILDELPKFDEMEKTGGSARLKRLWRYVKEKSALYASWRIIASLISPPDVAHFRGDSPKPWSKESWTTQTNLSSYRTALVEKSLDQLGRRITSLAEATRKIGAEPIFVTQRSVNWIEREGRIWGLKAIGHRRHADALEGLGKLTGVDWYWLERLQASTIMEACRKARAVCIDLARDIKIDHVKDFYDPIHTTPSGSRRIAEFLYSHLKDLP